MGILIHSLIRFIFQDGCCNGGIVFRALSTSIINQKDFFSNLTKFQKGFCLRSDSGVAKPRATMLALSRCIVADIFYRLLVSTKLCDTTIMVKRKIIEHKNLFCLMDWLLEIIKIIYRNVVTQLWQVFSDVYLFAFAPYQ